MRLSRQFQACLFFYEKISRVQKSKSSENQPTKQEQANKNNKGRNFLCRKTSKMVKIVCFAILKKKKNSITILLVKCFVSLKLSSKFIIFSSFLTMCVVAPQSIKNVSLHGNSKFLPSILNPSQCSLLYLLIFDKFCPMCRRLTVTTPTFITMFKISFDLCPFSYMCSIESFSLRF